MTQTRVENYGSLVTSQHPNWMRQYMLTPGVYSGLTLSADTSGDLVIAIGVGLQPDGVMWLEDTAITLDFSPPGAATNYTVYATHVDRRITHGVPVEYNYQNGLTNTITNGVVLGWIYHTGGGVPLDATMLVNAPQARADIRAQALAETLPVELYAPFPRTYSDITGMGPNVTFTGQTAADLLRDTTYFVSHQRVTKTTGPAGAETLTQYIQFIQKGSWRPVAFDFYCNIVGAGQLQVELRDTDLNIVTVTGSPITGSTTNWEWHSVTVDRSSGNFDATKPYELRVTSQVDLAQRIDLAIIVARYWSYPT